MHLFFVLSLVTYYDLRRKVQKVKNLLVDPSQRCIALKINVVVTNYSFILLKSFNSFNFKVLSWSPFVKKSVKSLQLKKLHLLL